jgi:hypothetical protein
MPKRKGQGGSVGPSAEAWKGFYESNPNARSTQEAIAQGRYTPPVVQPPGAQQSPYSTGAVPGTSPGMSQEEFSYASQAGLFNLQGNIQQELEQLRGATAIKGAEIAAGAAVRSAELDAEARRYLGDKDYLARTDVARIQGESTLRLQDIINAGLKDVEGIRQEGGKEIARISGEFDVKQETEKQRGQKDIAGIGERAGYRNALIGAFNF